jgi:hypothetical protein
LLIDVYINTQNSRIWNAENPHTFHKRPLHSLKVGVWCGIVRPHIRRRAESGNFSKHICNAIRAGVSWQIISFPTLRRKIMENGMEGVTFV